MRQLGVSGVWELFVPGVGRGTALQVRGPRRRRPVAREGRPDGLPHRGAAGDVVGGLRVDVHLGRRRLDDARAGGRRRTTQPMSVYEMHLGSWRRGRSLRRARRRPGPLPAADLGFTHVEFLPVMEHPFGGSWGYQVTSYFAPTSRFGDPDGFRYLVDRLHQAGIGVILDWVPGALPQGRVRAGPLRRHAALRGPEPLARRAPRLGHLRLQLRAPARCATSWSPTRCTGSRSSTSTGCASTPSPRCSTSTTPARPASGRPTSTAAARTSRRSRSCRR